MIAQIESLYRYPVKSLTGERLPAVDVTVTDGIVGDREFALARRAGLYRDGVAGCIPKTEFHTLAKHERLAGLDCRLEGRRMLIVSVRGHEVLRADLEHEEGKEQASRFFARVLDCEEDPPVIARIPGHRFTDTSALEGQMNYLSVINLASVRNVSERIGAELDPLRFRANFYWDGMPAFEELDLVGEEIQIGSARFTVTDVTGRCAATEVAPGTARRDIRLPRLMREYYGHTTLGIYLAVRSPGIVEIGDAVRLVGRRSLGSVA